MIDRLPTSNELREQAHADLTARLAEAERENDRLHGEAVAHEITNDELRAEVARLKMLISDARRVSDRWAADCFAEKQARESAEARLTALREAVDSAHERLQRQREWYNADIIDDLEAALAKSAEW